MNKWCGTGRMTKDADIRSSEETTVGHFTLAVDRRFKKGEADFITCVAFGKTAEWFEKYTHKGMKLEIVGRIQTGSYEKNGVKIYTTDIVVEEANFAESKKSGEEKPQQDLDDFVMVPQDVDGELPFA